MILRLGYENIQADQTDDALFKIGLCCPILQPDGLLYGLPKFIYVKRAMVLHVNQTSCANVFVESKDRLLKLSLSPF